METHQKEIENKLEEQEKNLRNAIEKPEKDKMKHLKSLYENEILNLKLKGFRSQMNPHFIFNALKSIKVYLIENEKEKAVYCLNKFSKLVRNILESSKTDNILLDEELEIIELYMSIENIRFENINQFVININDINCKNIKMPALIL